ncbi:MAG: cell envelope integrity EipB family protein [Rhodomicrobium sp.]
MDWLNITLVGPKMKHKLASPFRNACGASVTLLLALQPAIAQGAPAQDLAAHPPVSQQEAPAQSYGLASHRAVYELTLGDTGAGSNVSDIRGQLVYDFRGSPCLGYTLNTRLVTEVFDRDGKAATNDIRSESWEDAEGRRFRFSTSQYTNNKLAESTKGTARRPLHNRDAVNVDLEKPKKSSLSFSGKILFPTQHSLSLLKAAVAGRTRLQADIYDGSEKGTKLYETTSVIGAPLELSANSQLPSIKNAGLLDTIPSWPVVVSYYEPGPNKDGLPSYEISFRMYSNGVSRKLKLDYGTFSLEGELSSIEFFETKQCP